MDNDLLPRIKPLVRRGFGAETSVKRVEPLAGDASTRRYARAWLTGSQAPASAVIMILADRGVAISSEELAVFDEPPLELPYVNVHRFLERLGVAVPRLYVDASPEGLLLLEDVGDLPLRNAVEGQQKNEIIALFERAIDQLLLMQLEGTKQQRDDCLAFQQAFDERLFLWEFEHFIEHGLCREDARSVSERDLASLRQHFSDLARFLDRQPRYLTHRDFHGWNLFVQEEQIRVIDFQDALLAPAPYDLATLLGDRDTPLVVPPEIEKHLLDYYRIEWQRRGGSPWDPDVLWMVYSACALQKAFKVVGRFHYLEQVKNKSGYLRYIPPTLAQIRRLLDAWPKGSEMREILHPYFPELLA